MSNQAIAPIRTSSPIKSLHKAFQSRLALNDTDPIDVMLATLVSVFEDDVPLWVMMVAPPGSGKTETLMSLDGVSFVRFLSRLTPQTLVSGWSSSGNRSSLLFRLPNPTVLVIKDFTTVLRMRAEDRGQILAQFREVYDGSLDVSFGTGRDLRWRGKIGVLAGVTSVIDDISTYEQTLGERFLKIRIRSAPRQDIAHRALRNTSHERELKNALKLAVAEYLRAPRRRAAEVVLPMAREEQITALADFIAVARTTTRRNYQTREIDALAEPESPSRLARQFGLLARSLAAVRGHGQVEVEDIATTCRVGYESLTPTRRALLSALRTLDEGSGVKVTDVSKRLNLSWSATKRHLEEAQAVKGGLVESCGENEWALSQGARELLQVLEPFHP